MENFVSNYQWELRVAKAAIDPPVNAPPIPAAVVFTAIAVSTLAQIREPAVDKELTVRRGAVIKAADAHPTPQASIIAFYRVLFLPTTNLGESIIWN